MQVLNLTNFRIMNFLRPVYIFFLVLLAAQACFEDKKEDASTEVKEESNSEQIISKHSHVYNASDLELNLPELNQLDSLVYEDTIFSNRLFALDNLQYLLIHNPCVSKYPSELGRLKNLKTLNIDFNPRVHDLPDEWISLQSLEEFSMSKGMIKKFPKVLCRLPKLKTIRLIWQLSIDSVPDEIGNLAELEMLDLSGDGITYLSPAILKCKKLEALGLLNSHIQESDVIIRLRKMGVNVYLDSYIR